MFIVVGCASVFAVLVVLVLNVTCTCTDASAATATMIDSAATQTTDVATTTAVQSFLHDVHPHNIQMWTTTALVTTKRSASHIL